MTDRQTFSDEELTSYLDGEADATLAAAIAVARQGNTQIDARLADLAIDSDAMKSAFNALLDEAPNPPEVLDSQGGTSGWAQSLPLRSLAATAVLCLMLGALAGVWLTTPREATWREFAAAYHALYVNRTLAAVSNPRPVAEAELRRASDALGKKIELVAISQVGKLDYKRAQILGFKGRPLIQLAFLSKDGAPIALCIIRTFGAGTGGAGTGAIEMQEMHAMSSASWSKDGYSYFLVGGSDTTLIEQAAAEFAGRL